MKIKVDIEIPTGTFCMGCSQVKDENEDYATCAAFGYAVFPAKDGARLVKCNPCLKETARMLRWKKTEELR